MSHTWRYCPHCGKCFESHGGIDTLEIGIPFRKCQHCGGMIRLRHKQEWALMTTWQKAWQYVVVVLVAGMIASFGGLLGYWALTEKVLRRPNADGDGLTVVIVCIALMAPILWLSMKGLQRRIAESNRRIMDPTYRAILAGLGFRIPRFGHGQQPFPTSLASHENPSGGADSEASSLLSEILQAAGMDVTDTRQK